MNEQPTYGRRPDGFNDEDLCKPFQWIHYPPTHIEAPGNCHLVQEGEIPELKLKTCTWTYDDYHGYYDTACGDAFWLAEEWTQKFKFCPYCGSRISLASKDSTCE